jgi:hypothetical protein
MAISVAVRNENGKGAIAIYEGTVFRKNCSGNNYIAASTDGEIIAGLNSFGRITIFNTEGDRIRDIIISSRFERVSVSNGQIIALADDRQILLFDYNGAFKGNLRL